MKWLSLVLALGCLSGAQAASIAVIDSGLDYKHEMIVPNLWSNPLEVYDRRDNDGNGYQDDVHGWNFAEQNGEIIDYKYLGTFSPDCKKYFDVQGKMFLGQATESEIAWLRAKVEDPAFLAEMGKFGNFIHGTHVAGISILQSNNTAMGIKLLPTEVKLAEIFAPTMKAALFSRWDLLQKGFDLIAKTQMQQLTQIAAFIHSHKIDVANGSFGTGFNQVKAITDNAFKILFFRKPKEDESNKAAGMLIAAMVKHGKDFVKAAPNTLFVFAAGNDGLSNDEFGTSPANIKADNVISVGATYKNQFFASFSNYGVKNVDIAAPGMLIRSAIPGNEYLDVSGTSQAAPFVANVAAQIKDANPKLTPLEIKTILMSTVDKKSFLATRVTAGGQVNTDRAVVAAQMSVTMPVAEAVKRSRVQVQDETSMKSMVYPKAVIPLPLSPVFR